MTTEDLVADVKVSQSIEKFNQIFSRVKNLVKVDPFLFKTEYLGSEDLEEEKRLAVYEAIKAYNPEEGNSFNALARKYMLFKLFAISYKRKCKQQVQLFDVDYTNYGNKDLLINKLFIAHIMKILRQKDEKTYNILKMLYEGYTKEEISKRVHLSMNTINIKIKNTKRKFEGAYNVIKNFV